MTFICNIETGEPDMLSNFLHSTLLKEFLLMIIAVIAVQLALGLNGLLSLIDTAKNWGELLASGSAWLGSFSFALFVTVFKQALVWIITKLGGRPTLETKLAHAQDVNRKLQAENIRINSLLTTQLTTPGRAGRPAAELL